MAINNKVPHVPAKELTLYETGLLLKHREEDVLLLASQLKFERLRILQLEATNRILMLVCLAITIGCAKLVFEMQSNTAILQQRSTNNVVRNTEEEICDLIVHYDTQFGAGVYAGRDFHTKEIFQEMTG